MSLVKSFLNDSMNERRTMEEESFIALSAVFIGYFPTSVTISFPQSSIAYFLDLMEPNKKKDVSIMELEIKRKLVYLKNVVARENAASVTVVLVFADRTLKLLLHREIFLIFGAQINQHRARRLVRRRRRATRWSQASRIPTASGIRG
jgi:hypothetical protein